MALLSIVLPIYHVERYVQATLDSLADQTHRDLEVVMVDDGSTDRSAEIAAAFAERDPRFRLVRQDNGGLGHARNTGTRHATGEFLWFVDSDDLLPHYACRMAVQTLTETGSDFVSGNEYRFDSRGAYPTPMLESNFSTDQLRTTVAERPSLMRDLLPHNKVYRRSFWDAAGLAFPERILFEDGPVSVQAHGCARSVDLVSTPLYYWRLRDDTSRSLTQLFDDERFFVDRIYASMLSADFLAAHRPDLIEPFFLWDILHKYPVMFKALPDAPRLVQERFVRSAVPHLRRAPAEVIGQLYPKLRRRVEATMSGDLAAILATLPRPRGLVHPARPAAPVVRTARALAGRSHLLRSLRAFALVTPAAGTVRSTVMEFTRQGEQLRLRGYGHINGLPADGPLSAANRVIWSRHQDSRQLVRLRLRSVDSPEATAATGSAAFSYRKSGFEAVLPLAGLRDRAGRWRYGTWVFALGAATMRGLARGGLRLGAEAYRTDPKPVLLDDTTCLIPTVTNGVLGFRLEPAGAVLEECRLVGEDLVITGRLVGAAVGEPPDLVLGRTLGVPEVSVPAEWAGPEPGSEPGPESGPESGPAGRVPVRQFRTVVPLARVLSAVRPVGLTPLAGRPDRLSVAVRPASGDDDRTWRRLVCGPQFAGLAARVDRHRLLVDEVDGYLTVAVRPPGLLVERADWRDDGELVLAGTGADPRHPVTVVGRHSGHTERRVLPIVAEPDGSWHARIDPERVWQAGAAAALRSGLWRLAVRPAGCTGAFAEIDLPYSPGIFAGAPGGTIAFKDRYRLKRVGADALGLRIDSRLRVDDRGNHHGPRLQRNVYQRRRGSGALRKTVLYDSFNGKQYSDAPRAVCEELRARGVDLAHVWVTRDGQAPVPADLPTVEANSREWFEALAISRYVVANTHLPAWIHRRPGQVIAQTWHGIGFKRVAFDMDSVQFANPRYLEKLAQEAPNWSFLVSPSSFCTEIMRRAFRYDGEVCEIGSPRNDLLVAGDRAAITDRVRRLLGIPPDRKIILYAPTWRDNEYYGPGRYKFVMQLDVPAFPPELQRDYVLLVRRHPNTVDDLLGQDSDFVFDVANYPDVRELLAAADVLITDYSTISLDFANTGRPILYYAYDLADYRDNLRGFYFDLEREGPGPVLQTTAEVVEALADLPSVARDYRQRYEAIRKIYCHAEDGRATERFIERLLRDHPA